MKPSGFVSRCRGFPMAHPVPPGNARASMPAPLRAHRPRLTGPHGAPESRSARTVASTLALALDLPGPHEPRRVAQAAGGERRDCSRPWMAEFAPAAGCRATQGTTPAQQAARGAGVSFSLVSFSWTSKRKKLGRRRGGRNPATALNQKRKKPHTPRAHESASQAQPQLRRTKPRGSAESKAKEAAHPSAARASAAGRLSQRASAVSMRANTSRICSGCGSSVTRK